MGGCAAAKDESRLCALKDAALCPTALVPPLGEEPTWEEPQLPRSARTNSFCTRRIGILVKMPTVVIAIFFYATSLRRLESRQSLRQLFNGTLVAVRHAIQVTSWPLF